jgi:hypothetical protein
MPPQLARKSADQSGEHGPLARTAEADRPVDAARRPRGAAPAARRPGQTRHGSAAANTGTSELRSGTALEQPCTASSGAIGKRQLTSYASSSGEVHARDVACCQHLRIARQAACQPPVRTALPSAETSHPLNPRGARGALIRSGQNAASPGLLCAHEGSGADQACPGSSGRTRRGAGRRETTSTHGAAMPPAPSMRAAGEGCPASRAPLVNAVR